MVELMAVAAENLENDDVLNKTNMAFHREIAAATNNSVLVQLQEALTNLFQREQRVILDIYGSRKKDHAEHEGILDAIRRHDENQARERMLTHLDGVRRAIVQWDPEHTPLP